MTNTATRLITLIMLLQRQPNQRAADLATELDVSERTLHRYIGVLEEMGIPVFVQHSGNICRARLSGDRTGTTGGD